MSTHNVCFYGEISRIIPELPSNTLLTSFTEFKLQHQRLLGMALWNSCFSSIQTISLSHFQYRNDPKFSDRQVRLQEQSDQGLHCLHFCQHLSDA